MVRFLLTSLVFLFLWTSTTAAATCRGRDLWPNQPPRIKSWVNTAVANAPFGEGRFFRISKNGKSSYIFGTMHVPPVGKLRLPAQVTERLRKSNILLVEVTDTAGAAYWKKTRGNSATFFSNKPTGFSRYFSKSEWQSVLRKGRSIGFSQQVLEHMRPWFLYFTISNTGCKEGPGSNGRIMDSKIEVLARSARIRIQSLESPAMAFKPLQQFSYSEFARMTRTMLALDEQMEKRLNIDAGDMFKTGYNMYVRGQIQHIWQWNLLVISQSPEKSGVALAKSYLEKGMLLRRNQAWLPAILQRIQKGGAFIAVGAFHLGGRNGLLPMLQKRGYQITRIKLTN